MAGTTWPALVSGSKAKASEVESKFDWIEGSIVPMNAGSKTNAAYDLGESSYKWDILYVNKITPFSLTSAVTRYYSLSPADFRTDIDAYSFRLVSNGALGLDDNNSRTYPDIWAAAGVHLPHNALITNINYYFKGYSSYTASGRFWKASRTGTATQIGTTKDTSQTTSYQTLTDNTPSSTVDNINFSYYVTLYSAINTIYISGVSITYTTTEPLP